MHRIHLLGCGVGAASNNSDCRLGPDYLYQHAELFLERGIKADWVDLIRLDSKARGLAVVHDLNECLQQLVASIPQAYPLAVIGGDHSIAMGTWSGILQNHSPPQALGLLWVDAHMDAHTPQSSLSQNMHGMPLSYLLGAWDYPGLQPTSQRYRLNPNHVVVVGVHSYEAAEYECLRQLGVRIYFMAEIMARGLSVVLDEAMTGLLAKVDQLGISIDLDAFDPRFCPGVGYRVQGGVDLAEFLRYFRQQRFKQWVGLEIAEFNPYRDQQQKTAKAVVDIIEAIYF